MDSEFAKQLAEARLEEASRRHRSQPSITVSHFEQQQLLKIAEEMGVELRIVSDPNLRRDLEEAKSVYEREQVAKQVIPLRTQLHCAKKNVVFGQGCV